MQLADADHRYYDPTTNQFISVDPDLSKTGQAYAYVDNNPLDATDPTGLHCWSLHCLGNDIKHAAKSAGQFVKRNAGTIATIAAIGVCLSPMGLLACGLASAAALGARAYQRHENDHTPYLSAANGIDALVTVGSFGLLGATSSAGEGALEGSPSAVRTAYKIHGALSDFFGWAFDTFVHRH